MEYWENVDISELSLELSGKLPEFKVYLKDQLLNNCTFSELHIIWLNYFQNNMTICVDVIEYLQNLLTSKVPGKYSDIYHERLVKSAHLIENYGIINEDPKLTVLRIQ